MYSEIGFIFDTSLKISNNDNEGSIYGGNFKIKRKKPIPKKTNVDPGSSTEIDNTKNNEDVSKTEIVDAVLIYKDPISIKGNIPN